MSRRTTPAHLAATLLIPGVGLVSWPWLFGYAEVAPAVFSGSLVGLAMIMTAAAFSIALLDWASRAAIAIGAWSMAAPILFGFAETGSALLIHLTAGLLAMLAGVGGHELMARTESTDG